jgi:hypothetical protein
MSNDIYPTLRGLGYSVVKTPEFKTLVQAAQNEYETTIPQMRNPIWSAELIYDFLFDDPTRSTPGLVPYTDLTTLMGFFAAHSGQGSNFLFVDPDDNYVGPGVVSTRWAPRTFYNVGMGVLDGSGHWQQCTVAGTSAATPPAWNDGGGNTYDGTVTWSDEGSYGSSFPNLQAQLQVWNDGVGNYYSPLQRNLGGLFLEDITDLNPSGAPYGGPGAISVYANGVAQTVGVNDGHHQCGVFGPGLALPLNSCMGLYLQWYGGAPTPPVTASFNFFFRMRFAIDSIDFEKFMNQLWTIGGENGSTGSQYLKLRSSRPPAI